MRSAWPLCRQYSSIMWTTIHRRLVARPSRRRRSEGRSRPPSASASSSDASERAHGVLPERPQILGTVVGGRVPVPVGIGVPVDRVPRRPGFAAVEDVGEPVLLDERQVLQHPAERHRRGADGAVQRVGVQPVGLPGERRPVEVQEPPQDRQFVAVDRRFGPALLVDIGHGPGF